MANKHRTQASLGSDYIKKTKRDNKVGTLIVAKVKKVYYQEQTVELITVADNTSIANNFNNSGKLSAPYPKEFVGVTPENNIYGNVPIITPGMVVLVGFLGGNVSNPIIIGTYGNSEYNKKLARTPMISGDVRDTTQFKYNTAKFSLYPSLTMDYIDGEGDVLKTWNGNTFLSITSDDFNQESSTDYGYGTDYKGLDIAKYADGTVIESRVKKAPNMLVKHQGYMDMFGNEDNHITMFYLDSDGTFRHSVLNEEEQFRTYTELSSDGNYKVRLQEDSIIADDGQDFVEFGIDRESQTFFINNPHHKFEVKDEGIYLEGYPMIDNIDKDIDKAFKKLDELSEYIEKIDGILDGMGERSLREIIEDTNYAIKLTNDTSDKLKSTNNTVSNLSNRLENAITKYDGVMDNLQKSYGDLYSGVDNLRVDVRQLETDVKSLKDDIQHESNDNEKETIKFTRGTSITSRTVEYKQNEPVFIDGGIRVSSRYGEELSIPTANYNTEEGTISVGVKIESESNNVNILEDGKTITLSVIEGGYVNVKLMGFEIQSDKKISKNKHYSITVKWSIKSKTMMLFIDGELDTLRDYDYTENSEVGKRFNVGTKGEVIIGDFIKIDKTLTNKQIKERL